MSANFKRMRLQVVPKTAPPPLLPPCFIYLVAMIVINAIATSLVFKHVLPLMSVFPDEEDLDMTTPTDPDPRRIQRSLLQVDASHYHDQTTTIIDNIISKWNISTSSDRERDLLHQIWNKNEPYDSHRDLIVFYHPMKSGGTSLSRVLTTLGGVVPGSEESGYFNFKTFKQALKEQISPTGNNNNDTSASSTNTSSKQQWWSSQRVLFSHSPYRGYKQSQQTRLASYLHDKKNQSWGVVPIKRIRHITMVRDPLAFVSSNYAEWFCQLGHWERQAKRYKMPPSGSSNNSSSCAYTLTDRTEARKRFTREECQNLTKSELRSLRSRSKQRCTAYLRHNQKDPTPECASISNFLSSDKFQQFFTNVYKDQTNYNVHDDDKQVNNNNVTTTVLQVPDDYIYGALEFFGGIDTTTTTSTSSSLDQEVEDSEDGSEQGEGDMMWFGITERMHESMCLFHYQTGLPLVPTPSTRYKECRPTSFWSNVDKQRYRQSQILDHAVYNAANAILDLRLHQMRLDLWSRLHEQVHLHNQQLELHANGSDDDNDNLNTTTNILNQTLKDFMHYTSLECMGPKPSSTYSLI